MFQLYIVILLYSYFRAIRGCFRIITSCNYLSKVKTSLRSPKKSVRFIILIPLLREQDIIEDTIKHFCNLEGNYIAYLITTSKEDDDKKHNTRITERYKQMPTTRQLIQKILSLKPNMNIKVKHLHSPNIKGVAADQYNYALNKLSNKINSNDYVIIYNADSRIQKNTLKLYEQIIKSHNNCLVIQQSSLFLSNYNQLSGFLKSIALLQTRWTLAHEIPRILRTNGILSFTEGAHVVGHGLCINYQVLKNIGGFPTNYLNEDLALGYFLRLHGYKIHSLKSLENADTPTSIKSMFYQYRTWFYGVIFYPQYMINGFSEKKFDKFYVTLWGIKYFIRGLLWLNLSGAWLFLFIFPLVVNRMDLLFWSILSFIIYAPVSFGLIHLLFRRTYNMKEWLAPIIFSPVAYLTHSIGPLLATFDIAKMFITGKGIYKNKTER